MGEEEPHLDRFRGEEITAVLESGDELRLRRLAMDAAGVGTWVHDLDTDVTYGDATARALFGFQKEYVPFAEFIQSVVPEDRSRLHESIRQTIESETGQFSIDYRVAWPDSTVRWLTAKGEVVREEEGEARKPARIIGIVMDITAEKKAQDALRASQEWMSFVIESSDLGIWEWDLDTDEIKCSGRWLELFGLPSDYRMTKELFLKSVHPEDRERVTLSIQDVLAGLKQYRLEMRIVRPDESVRWILKSGRCYFGEDGRPRRMLGSALDITELKKAETALTESEALFKSVFRASVDAIVLLDNNGACVDVNRATGALFDSAGLDVTGKCLFAMFGEDFTPYWETFLKEGCYQRRHEIKIKGFPPLILDVSGVASVVKDRHLFVLRDITQRESLLREHEEQHYFLDQVIDTVPVPVWISRDPKCLTMTGNKAAYKILRMPAGVNISESARTEDLPRTYKMGRRGMPVDHQDLPMQRAARLDREVIGEELDIYYDGGKTLHLLGNAAPLHDGQGNVAGAVGVFMDITYRTQYEQHLKALAAKLERSNKDLEQFAYIVSHDLQEPLRQVVRFSEILHQRYKDQLDQAAHEFLDFVVEGGKRMQRLIKDLLAYSKVERVEPEVASVSMEEILETAMLNLATSIRTSAAVVTHDPLPVVDVDRVQFVQVFQNLISNAIKFHGDQPPRIHVGVERHGENWLFHVSDNGIGFEPQLAETIFELFRQLSTRAKKKGTGIGLAICKRVVETHGGRIWAKSQPGHGATFYFTLPA